MKLTVFDVETTGVDVETARIVTAYVGVMDAHYPGERPRLIDVPAAFLFDPGIEIPESATKIHGITTDRARMEGTPAADGLLVLEAHLAAMLLITDGLVAFNAAYDLTVLEREIRRHHDRGLAFEPFPIIDPYVIDKALSYRPGKRTLTDQAKHYGLEFDGDAHDAGADARMAGMLAFRLLAEPKIRDAVALPDSLTAAVHRWSIVWRRRQQDSLADYFRSIGRSADDVRPEWPILPGGYDA